MNLGIDLAAQGRMQEARAQYDQAVKLSPNDPASYCWRGLFFSKQGDTEAAIADLRKAVDHSPVPDRELQALADNLIKAGRIDEARTVIERGSKLDPEGLKSCERD